MFANGRNPVARSNVVPPIDPPAATVFHAFSYARPGKVLAPNFVISGSGEVSQRGGSYLDHTVARGDTSPAGMRAKALCVVEEMERRMAGLGVGWADTTDSQVYTVFDVHSYMAEDLVRRGPGAAALPGISAGRRWSNWNSSWIAAGSRANRCFDSEWPADVGPAKATAHRRRAGWARESIGAEAAK